MCRFFPKQLINTKTNLADIKRLDSFAYQLVSN